MGKGKNQLINKQQRTRRAVWPEMAIYCQVGKLKYFGLFFHIYAIKGKKYWVWRLLLGRFQFFKSLKDRGDFWRFWYPEMEIWKKIFWSYWRRGSKSTKVGVALILQLKLSTMVFILVSHQDVPLTRCLVKRYILVLPQNKGHGKMEQT